MRFVNSKIKTFLDVFASDRTGVKNNYFYLLLSAPPCAIITVTESRNSNDFDGNASPRETGE